MKQLVKMQFGSHIYGTNTPKSDKDYKGVFIPDAKSLVMQTAAKNINLNTKTDTTQKNSSTDVDDESYSIAEYLRMLMRGETGAVDMLFTPREFYTEEPHELWLKIVNNREKLVHKSIASFVGYCQTQAAKYSLKGSNLASFRLAQEYFASKPPHSRVEEHLEEINKLLIDVAKAEQIYHDKGEPIIKWVQLDNKGTMETFLQIGKKTKHGLRVKCELAAAIWQDQVKKYGARAKLAETNEGVDWKALMHALRVAREAEELLLTGHITFPRPERELLLKVRNEELSYAEVADLIVESLDRVNVAKEKSTLKDKPDMNFINELIFDAHLDEIKSEYIKFRSDLD